MDLLAFYEELKKLATVADESATRETLVAGAEEAQFSTGYASGLERAVKLFEEHHGQGAQEG